MKNTWFFAVIVAVFLACFSGPVTVGAADDVPRITKEQLKDMLGDPNLVIIDVRTGPDWRASDTKIKGAIREKPHKVDQWAGKFDKEKTYVLYCA